MRSTARYYWRRTVVAALVCLCCRCAVADEVTYVVPNRYLVQRTARSVARLSSEPPRYTVVRPTTYFDVVTPSRYVSALSTRGTADREVLQPAKVSVDCADILRDPTVESCEPDVIYYPSAIPNDPSFSRQWYLRDPSQDADVEASVAWDNGTGSGSTLIGIVDTGVYWSHPDLVDNMWTNPDEPVDGVDNDGNGYIDDVFGVNTMTGSGDPNDPHGHGTHVAGIIAARGNNSLGVTGVMWRASLIGVSATNSSSGAFTTSSLVAGLNYFHDLKVAGHNVRVVNASWGGYSYSSAMNTAISQLNDVGVLLVCAAGNDDTNNDDRPHYPSDYDWPNVVSVGATGPTKRSASYSNYGTSVDIAAPGGDTVVSAEGYIYSTQRSATPGLSVYVGREGTSMAAPVVTGALGLIVSQRPALTGSELRSLLLTSADTVSEILPYVNQGRFLNIGAMSAVANGGDECPDDPDKVVPGACGCGAPDVDANGNGTPDCLDPPDNCPGDSAKLEPGVCGCGTSDDDLNGNGRVDCQDPKVDGVTPPAPVVKVVKGKVVVSMTGMSGVVYAVKMTTLAPKVKGKAKPTPKTVYLIRGATSYTSAKLKAKTKVAVSYAYVLQGTPLHVSRYSSSRSVTVK